MSAIRPINTPRSHFTVIYRNDETDQHIYLNFQPRWDADIEEITEILRTVLFAMGYDRGEVNESFPHGR